LQDNDEKMVEAGKEKLLGENDASMMHFIWQVL